MNPLVLYYGLITFSIFGIGFILIRNLLEQKNSERKQLQKALKKAESFTSSLEHDSGLELESKNVRTKTSSSVSAVSVSAVSKERVEQKEKEIKKLLKQADIFMTQKSWDDAEKILIQALSYDEYHPEALKCMAEVYVMIESYSRAIFFLDQYFQRHEVCSTTANHYALAHFYLKDFPVALKYFSKAIDLEPSNSVRYAHLGEVFITLESYTDAVKCYTEALKIEPRNIEYHRSIAHSLRLSNSFTEAKQWYQKILDLSPYDGDSQKQIEKLDALGF